MTDTTATPGRTVTVNVPTLVVALLAGIVYAWFVWDAVADLFATLAEARAFEVPAPWIPMIGKILLPVVVWLVAYLAGRSRRLWERVVLFASGLAVTAALGFGFAAVVRAAMVAAVRGL